MAQKLVAVLSKDGKTGYVEGEAQAKRLGLQILDEPTHTRDGRVRQPWRANGRPAKRKTSVAREAARKKAEAAKAEATRSTTDTPSDKENAS